MIFLPTKIFFFNTHTTCSKLPSNISTMLCWYVYNYSVNFNGTRQSPAPGLQNNALLEVIADHLVDIVCMPFSCSVCPGSSDQFYIVSYYINYISVKTISTKWSAITSNALQTRPIPLEYFNRFFLSYQGYILVNFDHLPPPPFAIHFLRT